MWDGRVLVSPPILYLIIFWASHSNFVTRRSYGRTCWWTVVGTQREHGPREFPRLVKVTATPHVGHDLSTRCVQQSHRDPTLESYNGYKILQSNIIVHINILKCKKHRWCSRLWLWLWVCGPRAVMGRVDTTPGSTSQAREGRGWGSFLTRSSVM
ncbi:Protein of unknown function [Pyronema omphalodes CBS 100304]|uniref:Uncharacterized protein n=1 Tax=Pyronema omphalodes (strain CBS 100304) TaxID=1076935 RepID=U4LBI1_PYROM|nr:Protein of unknown function [Pyronema omphalodes CBS 100304]